MSITAPKLVITLVVVMLSAISHSATRRFRPAFAAARSTAVRNLARSASVPTHDAFRILSDRTVHEYDIRAIEYEHLKSGAQVISMISSDDNKVFGATFRTPPADSTGLPHVLEHSVLCGSRKYPTKEPFVHLLKGSLNTFLNAFTYPDRTCYPVASMNLKDFYNLVDVYLDAVLYPRALKDHRVLAQEGWHYSMEDITDPLSYKGVVYNEMKGVYSSPEAVLSRATQQALFPDTAYGNDSGGTPEKIPDMTFDSFKNFHSTYYHPANSRMFFYGNDDPVKRLEVLDEYLKDFTKIDVGKSSMQYQKRFTTPKLVETVYPTSSATEKKHMYTVNWVVNDHPLEQKEKLALSVLNHLLFATADSLMRKTLMESGLGDGIIADYGDELLQGTLEVGMRGVPPENREALHELILKTFSHLAESGFEESAVKASMNTVEFHLREFNTGGYPKGLSLMLGMMPEWIHDRDPVEAIQFEGPLSKLKGDIAANVPVFQDLIKKYVLDNTHKVVVDMKPDSEFENNRQGAEAAHLAQVRGDMSPADLEAVVRTTRELLVVQAAEDSPEAKATLPRLELGDIDTRQSEIPITVEALPGTAMSSRGPDCAENSKLLCHALPTSGILYANVAIDIADVPSDDLELLPLFARMLTQTGTSALSSVELSRKIGTETGGIGSSYHSSIRQKSGVVSDPNDALLYFVLSGKSVGDKVTNLFDLFEDVLCDARLDNQKRAVEMLKQSKAARESSVISSGHSYAAMRLRAQGSPLGFFKEATSGITYARALDRLLDDAEKDWDSFSRRLESLRHFMLNKFLSSVVVNLTGDEDVLAATKPVVGKFLDSVAVEGRKGSAMCGTGTPFIPAWKESMLLPSRNEGFIIPSQVNYVVKGGNIFSPGEPVRGSFTVAARFLNTGYLWDTVRVMGGAYGGSGSFGAVSGQYIFSSYRDPNVFDTLRAYDGAADSLRATGESVTDDDVLEAVIGAIGDLDSPQSPDQKGYASMSEYLHGGSASDRQQWRDDILATSAADFVDFGKRLSVLNEKGSVVVFGSAQSLEAANTALDDRNKLVVEVAFDSATKYE